jgi:hypothetical protein
VHQYLIDWNTLSRGEEGVTVQVDSNGDGVFEHTFTSDSELTQGEYLGATTKVAGEVRILSPRNGFHNTGYVNITFSITNIGDPIEFKKGDWSNRIDVEIEFVQRTPKQGVVAWSTGYNGLTLGHNQTYVETISYDFVQEGGEDVVVRIVHHKLVDPDRRAYSVGEFGKDEVTLFSWNYIFEDTGGRGTTLKINLPHALFQFVTPSKDYGVRKATYMQQYGRAIILQHLDKELHLITVTVDTKLDFCFAIAQDLQTHRYYLLFDTPGRE